MDLAACDRRPEGPTRNSRQYCFAPKPPTRSGAVVSPPHHKRTHRARGCAIERRAQINRCGSECISLFPRMSSISSSLASPSLRHPRLLAAAVPYTRRCPADTGRESHTHTHTHTRADPAISTSLITERLCSRRWSTFDVWDVAVGGVGRGVGSDSNTGLNP